MTEASILGRPSFQVGHVTDEGKSTGCTVVMFDGLTPSIVDVRGGAPGTRETDLLAAGRSLRSVDAILLTGGSAFGLAAADGVVRFLAEHGRGYPTSTCPIPIVPAAVVFDGPRSIDDAPDSAAGYAACQRLAPPHLAQTGQVGVGTGCTISKLWGPENVRPGGVGIATRSTDNLAVTAIVAVNAVGTTFSNSGQNDPRSKIIAPLGDMSNREATTIGVVVVGAPVDHTTLERCGIAAHDGLARSIVPSHTAFDGDTFFVSGPVNGHPDSDAALQVQILTELAVEEAISIAIAPKTVQANEK